MSEHTNISAALVAAQRAVDVASKDARNAHHGYDYASAEEVVSVGSAALTGSGLAFGEEQSSFEAFPVELLKRAERNDKPYPDGVGGALGMLTVVYGLVHESGERREVRHVFPVVPEKGRPLDKALAASRTECLAYALRGLLLMQRRPKDHRRAKIKPALDVSGRNDAAPSVPMPVGTTAPQPGPTGMQPASPPVALTHPKLAAIVDATRGEEALVALSAARQDRTVDPLAAEDAFLSWLIAKCGQAMTLEPEKTAEMLSRIEGALGRASLLPERTKTARAAIANAAARAIANAAARSPRS